MTPSGRALIVFVALTAPAFAGCLQADLLDSAATRPGTDGSFDTARGWSSPLTPAVFDKLEPVKHFVESFDGTPIGIGIFRPHIAGCDWEATDLPETCRRPVVMDAGPYYANSVDVETFRPPLIEWLVPRGYAVVKMSIRGTGESGGCMELFSMNEQKDVDHMVTWLAEQPWSNGNIGMMGRSYDGTTPLMAAAHGNPHLKTIVPISGVMSLRDLMYKNGTSEFRGPIFHSVVYWANFGLGAADGGAGPGGHRFQHYGDQACEDAAMGAIEGPSATLTGDASSEYWTSRDFRHRVAENFKGSVWVVHGLEDWNVNPSQAVPWINELQDAGIPTKAWLGVWGHAYPDRVDEHRNVRWDWAHQTVAWMDYYLKGEGAQPALDIEVEDSQFVWRKEASYPPRDVTFRDFALSGDMTLQEEGATAGSVVLVPPPDTDARGQIGPGATALTFTSEPLAENLRIAGLPRLHITATPSTAYGTHLFAELYDVFPDGRSVRLGFAAMNLRYHDGGNLEPATLTPGEPVLAKMEFEPTDAHVGAGHRLRLLIHQSGVEDILGSPSPEPTLITLGESSVLHVSAVDRPTIVPAYTAPGLGVDA